MHPGQCTGGHRLLTHPALHFSQNHAHTTHGCMGSCAAARVSFFHVFVPGALPEGVPEEPEVLGENWRPEGLEHEVWSRFEIYRGARVRLESEQRRLTAQAAVLRKEVCALVWCCHCDWPVFSCYGAVECGVLCMCCPCLHVPWLLRSAEARSVPEAVSAVRLLRRVLSVGAQRFGRYSA